MTVHRPPVRIPRAARPLGAPLWLRTQGRIRERYGFDLNARDAVERAAALLSESPDDADRLLLHAAALATRGDDAAAERDVRRALDHNPSLARAHTTLATLLVRAGDVEAGLAEARAAAGLDAADPTVQYNLGLAEHAAGHRHEAAAAFAAARNALQGEGAAPPRSRWWQRMRRHG
ncbi:MAG: hypothetical protein E6J14_04540 [Chloroflexi bacterium]|nr:MAG: hypothetical protein E6J14_04540 [Chloroflexota bacterium]